MRAGSRQRADGVRLSWSLTDPDPLVAGRAWSFAHVTQVLDDREHR